MQILQGAIAAVIALGSAAGTIKLSEGKQTDEPNTAAELAVVKNQLNALGSEITSLHADVREIRQHQMAPLDRGFGLGSSGETRLTFNPK